MQIDFAPMEGITGFPFRNAFEEVFGGIRSYYTPFLTVNQNKKFGSHDIRDVDRENNHVPDLIPQILTNKPDQLAWGLESLYDMGYREVNLNLGCPSPTVTKRNKGAGFLADLDQVDELLEETFQILEQDKCPVALSVKTRIGMGDDSRFPELLEIYNRYPLSRLIIHPRLGAEGYQGDLHMEVFDFAYENSTHPLIYNGELRDREMVESIARCYPELDGIMIGRGFLYDPGMLARDSGIDSVGASSSTIGKVDQTQTMGSDDVDSLQQLCHFHEVLLREYMDSNTDPNACVPRMKEIWGFWASNPVIQERFTEKEFKKILKAIRKSKGIDDYQAAVAGVF